MILLPEPVRLALRAQFDRSVEQEARGLVPDPAPLLKLFNPIGPATWLATELAEDDDILFGLADLGFGCPELGYFSLRAITGLRLPFGLSIARDSAFISPDPLSVWVDWARRTGSIRAAECQLMRAAFPAATPLPPAAPDPGNDNDGKRPGG